MGATAVRLVFAATLAAFGIPAALAAEGDAARDFPGKPIRFLVPFAAGGANDVTARLIGQKLGEMWGQQVVADNRPGAAGTIAVHLAAQAAPDGYTVCLISASQTVSAAVNPKLPYDLTRDLQAITQLTSLFYVMSIHPSVPVKSVRELIAYAKAHPGKLNYGSSGTFGLQHLAGEMLQHLTAIRLVHVPYKGGAAALAEMLSGQIEMGFNTLISARPHIESGRIRALAITARKRSPALPHVPTLEEAGVPGYEVDQWFGVITRARVPPAIVAKLSTAMNEAVRSPDVAGRLAADGSTPVGTSPDAFGAHVKTEIEKWRQLATDAKLSL